MLAPNAEQIETAIDQLKTGGAIPAWLRDSQKKELHSAGPEGYATNEFANGYELGLQTARVVIAGSTALILKGVDPKDVL